MAKKALLIGIDDYAGAELDGCVADAVAMGDVLSRNHDEALNYEARVETSDNVTLDRTTVRRLLSELFENPRDDELLFYFSGHGAQSRWGAELVTQDYAEHALGVSMDDVMTLATTSPAREVVIIFDCCFSGALGNVTTLQQAGVDPEWRFGRALVRENVTLMAASHDREPAVESAGQGVFTRLLVEGLEGGAGDHLGHVTALSLYAFASRAFGAWEQRPVFKSNLTEPSVLRRCAPFIDPAMLRRLPEFFATPEARIRMDPEHEGEGRPLPREEGTEKQKAFDYFKALRNAGLLTTDDDKDLYFVAMDSEEVFLTSAGRYFWNLAHNGRL
jgi:uncharacterized caspase-like protein